MLGIWIFIGAICLGVVLILACYTIPQWLTQSYTFATDKEKADAVDANRKTLAQVLGGFALVVTFAWTVLKDGQTLDQGRLQLANQQFIEGAKLLKESNVGASAAGVHASPWSPTLWSRSSRAASRRRRKTVSRSRMARPRRYQRTFRLRSWCWRADPKTTGARSISMARISFARNSRSRIAAGRVPSAARILRPPFCTGRNFTIST